MEPHSISLELFTFDKNSQRDGKKTPNAVCPEEKWLQETHEQQNQMKKKTLSNSVFFSSTQ